MTMSVHVLMLEHIDGRRVAGVFKDKQRARRYANEWNDHIKYGGADRDEELDNQVGPYETVGDVRGHRRATIESEPVR